MTALLNYDKIKGLIYTEKSNKQLADGKYHFQIDASCDKNQIASLIKKVFNVEVEWVNIINTAISRFSIKITTKYYSLTI